MWLFEISSSQVNLSSVSVLNNIIVYRDGRETFVTAPFMSAEIWYRCWQLCFQVVLVSLSTSSFSHHHHHLITIVIKHRYHNHNHLLSGNLYSNSNGFVFLFCYLSVVVFFIAELIIIHSGRVWMWKSNQNMIWLYLYNSLLKSLLGDGHIVTWFLIGWGPFYWHELTFISAWIIITCPVKCVLKLHIHSQTSTAVPLKFANA